MANTWHASFTSVTFASAKSMCDLFNADSTRILRLYRIWMLNNQVSAVTGVITTMKINKLISSVPTGGTTVTPQPHDSTNSALSNATCGTGRTPTRGNAYRTFLWSNDEPTVGTGSIDEMECLVPLGIVWDSGYGDPNIQPLTLRQNEGWEVQQSGSSTVGVVDFDYEFTDSDS